MRIAEMDQIAARGQRRGLNIYHFAALVVLVSSMMVAAGYALYLEPADDGAPAIADRELEDRFAPAAGGDAPTEAAGNGGFSLQRSMKHRLE